MWKLRVIVVFAVAAVFPAIPGAVASSQTPRDAGVWFELVDTKVSNPQGPQLTIDAKAENAVWDVPSPRLPEGPGGVLDHHRLPERRRHLHLSSPVIALASTPPTNRKSQQ